MNLDFADLKRALKNSGVALIGYGIGSGVDKCSQAVENAVNNPLLETTISGARNVLCGISMGPNVSMNDVMLCINKISRKIRFSYYIPVIVESISICKI